MERNNRKALRSSGAQKAWRFNLLDAVILLLVLLFIASAVVLLIPGATRLLGDRGDTPIVYTVVFSEVDEKLALSADIYDGQTVIDESTGRVIGTVIGDALVDDCYEFVIKDENAADKIPMLESELYQGKKTLTVTLTASATYSEGKGYEVNGCRIACNKELTMIFPGFTGKGICTVVTENDSNNY